MTEREAAATSGQADLPRKTPRSTPKLAHVSRALARHARVLTLVFASQFAIMGLALRPVSPLRDALAASLSLVFWWLLARVLTKRVARVVVAAIVAFVIALEWDYFHRYHVTLDAQALACARQNWADVRGTVDDSLRGLLLRTIAILPLELALLQAASLLGPLTHRKSAHGAIVALAAIGLLVGRRTPEFELAGGTVRFLRPPEAVAMASVSVPLATVPLRSPPSVLFILSESIRASDYCADPPAPCETAPRLQALLPDRVNLHYMRSVGSYTSIALSGLYTGIHQVRPRQEILAAPTLFDFIRALRTEEGASIPTRYFSAHLPDYMMGRELGADTIARLDDLTGHPDGILPKSATRGADGLVLERYLAELEKGGGADFTMLHLSGTHVRYTIDKDDAPFQPWTEIVSYDRMNELRNKYKNAIHMQDKMVADAVRAFLKAVGARPYVIFFTSDHGEAFAEHEAIHHGQSLHDEQAHVPAWIVNGNGAIPSSEWQNVIAHRDQPLTHLDIVPSLLDLYRATDALPLKPQVSRLEGRSFLRSPRAMAAPIPISNCPVWFECPISNWGIQKDDLLLIANVWNAHWNCANVKTRAEWLDGPECREMVELSKRYYPTLPNGLPNR